MPGQGNRIDFVTGAPELYADLVDALAVIPGQYRTALSGASDVAMRREPSDDPAADWSTLRHLAHSTFLAEQNDVFIGQMARMTLPRRREFPLGYVAEDLEALPVAEILDRMQAAVGSTVGLLSHTPDAAWGRPGEVRGLRRSLRQMVVAHIHHLDEHLTEIARLLKTVTPAR